MCEVTVVKYIHRDGRRETVEKKRLCFKSDGQNQCINTSRKEVTQVIRPATPDLTYDNTPASMSIPGTPLTATAPSYEIREPQSKIKGKGRVTHITLTKKKSGSPRRKRSSERAPRYYEDDDDPIVAIEERFGPASPNRVIPPPPPQPSFGPALSIRQPRRQSTIINQPNPPRPATQPTFGYHRRNSTAPDLGNFSADNEIFNRANAREELRRENTFRRRREDEKHRAQVEEDRRLAEKLQKKEAEEQTMDEFSMREYRRLQAKDDARRKRDAEKLAKDEDSKRERAEVERIRKEIEEHKQRDRLRQRTEEDAREDSRRREDARLEDERQKREELRQERIIKEELEQHRRERLEATAADLRAIQHQINVLEHELQKTQLRRTARERAEALQEEIRHHNLLQEEIRQMEEQQHRDTAIDTNDSELRRLEADLLHLNTRIRERERNGSHYSGSDYDPIDGPPSNERRNIGMGSPPARVPVDVVQRRSPFQSEEYRRAIGEQVLARERNLASARAAASDLQGVMGSSGLSRRNTIGGGNRGREQRYVLPISDHYTLPRKRLTELPRYRDLRKWYPE
jgi:hypothetical protein